MNFRIEIFAKVRNSQKNEFEAYCPELVLLTVPNFREYFYTKIQFSTPGSKFRCINLGSKSFDWPNIPVLIYAISGTAQLLQTRYQAARRQPSTVRLDCIIEYLVVTIQVLVEPIFEKCYLREKGGVLTKI